MIQKAFRDVAMSAVQIKVWHKHFKDGQESVKSDPSSGRPATIRTHKNVQRVQAAINKDWWLTVQKLEADLGIPKTAVSEILMQDLGMKRVVAKFILWLLLPEQKEHGAAVATDLIQTATNEPDFLKKVITRDELWVYSHDPETKAQPSQWKSSGSPHPKEVAAKSHRDQNHVNCVFWLGSCCPSQVHCSRPTN